MRALLLDETYFPVKIINWQKAMILMLTQRAEVLDIYQEFKIRSVSNSFELPKILRLYRRHKSVRDVKFSRQNVFLRDNYQCQYCRIKLPAARLTFDHVIPVSKMGDTCWENVVSCCAGCNTKKGNKTLKETNMKLIRPPFKPKWAPKYALKFKEDDPKEWMDWLPKAKQKLS